MKPYVGEAVIASVSDGNPSAIKSAIVELLPMARGQDSTHTTAKKAGAYAWSSNSNR